MAASHCLSVQQVYRFTVLPFTVVTTSSYLLWVAGRACGLVSQYRAIPEVHREVLRPEDSGPSPSVFPIKQPVPSLCTYTTHCLLLREKLWAVGKELGEQVEPLGTVGPGTKGSQSLSSLFHK